jgi:hypothetical protein
LGIKGFVGCAALVALQAPDSRLQCLNKLCSNHQSSLKKHIKWPDLIPAMTH